MGIASSLSLLISVRVDVELGVFEGVFDLKVADVEAVVDGVAEDKPHHVSGQYGDRSVGGQLELG